MSPMVAVVERRFSAKTLNTIAHANAIIVEYAAQGFDLTLRQLYYQFVAREKSAKAELQAIADNYDDVVAQLGGGS